MHLGGQIDWGSETQPHKQHSLCLATLALRGNCHKGSQTTSDLCHLNCFCFVSARKHYHHYHSSDACPVSQISASVTKGNSRSDRKPETMFSLYHSYYLCNEGLCFLRLPLGINFLELIRTMSSARFLGLSLAYMAKPQKDLLVCVTIKKILFINGQAMDPLNWKNFQIETFLERVYLKQLFYWYPWEDQIEKRTQRNIAAPLRDLFKMKKEQKLNIN